MSFTVSCYTLFDITQTGTVNRNKPALDEDENIWLHKRNTQCNFDTVLQAISLRSQPEIIRMPEKTQIRFDEFTDFGFLYQQQENELYNCWSFDFEIQHLSVFDNGISELGALYDDCDGIPMLKVGNEWDKLPEFLDASDELKNIYFKITNILKQNGLQESDLMSTDEDMFDKVKDAVKKVGGKVLDNTNKFGFNLYPNVTDVV